MMDRLARSLALFGAVVVASAAGPALAAEGHDRSLRVTLTPAPNEVSLAQISFPHAGMARPSPATLEVSAPSVFGSDYLAVAVLRPGLGGAVALALVANRPSPLLDPAGVSLTVRARRALGAPGTRSVQDVLSLPAGAGKPRLCDLALHGKALNAADLAPLGGRGPALSGLGGAQALAQAYDIACGLPSAESLRTALSAPVGGGCTPCEPPPGYACPLTQAAAAICAEPLRAGRRAAAGATH